MSSGTPLGEGQRTLGTPLGEGQKEMGDPLGEGIKPSQLSPLKGEKEGVYGER